MTAATAIGLTANLQILLVAGVLGYLIAFSGYRREHKTIEQVAFVLVFSAPAALILAELDERSGAALAAVGVGVGFGFLWRWAAPRVRRFVEREMGMPWDDSLPGVWQRIMLSTEGELTQLTVTLKDGTALHCAEVFEFANRPDGPCLFGFDGSVGLYVTHIAAADGDFRDDENVTSAFGAEMTFVPVDEIARIRIRRLTSAEAAALRPPADGGSAA